MKTLKLSVIAIALFAVSFTANAKTTEEGATPAAQFRVINTYVDALTRGKIDGLDKVVDNSAKFGFLHGKKIHSYDKTEMLDYLKSDNGAEQNCVVSTSLVSNDANVAVVKVEMQYDGLTRSNYVTLANNGKDWKITDVYTVFK